MPFTTSNYLWHISALLALSFAANLGTVSAETKTTSGSSSMQYRHVTVEFDSHGETLIGQLFLPAGEGPFAAVSIMGPVAFVKEQSPLQYASRIVRQGIAALIFDPRYHGASSGEPRRFESPQAKIEDLSASIDFLAGHKQIDAQKIGLVGICQGVNWAIEASVRDKRVKSLALVAGHYLLPEIANMYLGNEKTVQQRLERGRKAKMEFDQNGKVEYIEIVGSKEALLTHELIDDWYQPWAKHAPWFSHRGQWENRITAMSEADIWGWRIDNTLRPVRNRCTDGSC